MPESLSIIKLQVLGLQLYLKSEFCEFFKACVRVVSAFFCQIVIFHQMIALQKL